ncbi:MAG: hypothetical protein GVY12_01955 [Bacteroidetes bacterium]|jgi:hypothetical protein|nr:hypothetical protein [Bacteroidota bacterium]
MTIPDEIQSLADDLGMSVEGLLRGIARREDLLTRIEQVLRPFSLMGCTKRLRPEEPQAELVARVWCGEAMLYASYPEYNEGFTEAMHRQNMTWNKRQRRWERTTHPWMGALRDRLVELCCEVLAAGFVCEIPHEKLADDVLHERYEPEHTRWILRRAEGDYENYFAVRWGRDRDDLYQEARALPGSRYDRPRVVVPADAYAAVLDFAERYGFRLSDSAQALVQAAREAEAADLIATPDRPEKADPEEHAPDLDPASVSQEIDPALRDTPQNEPL